MTMDPGQLSWMQDATQGMMPGGQFSPHPSGGAGYLAQLAQGYSSPIQGNPLPDTSPLAPLNLQQYGIGGMLAGAAGNSYLSNQMHQQGLLPMGNAGSYMQAHRTREHLRMKNEVSAGVSGQDADGIYRSFRGAAALAGVPFDRKQREAARNVSESIASLGPTLAMVAPDFMDAVSGEKGSVQAMAGQMMEANRYRADPVTGKMGYSTESNKNLVNNVFENMFSKDNMAQMNGMRAGDMGQAYKQLSAEGLVGPTGSLRDRTIQSLQEGREQGMDLKAIGKKAGVEINDDTNLAALSNESLTKLRKDSTVSAKMGKDDARQVSDQLQGYVGSLSAIREVFGENGDANAPVPKLINALKAMTSGQMQKFSPGQLTSMVRDMQSMSQLSGKSIDQLTAMNQYANTQNSQMMGGHGVHFNPTSLKVGTTTGMAFAEHGGATGFGALNREQAEQASMGLFSRGMGSQMNNALGALTRIEESGGFAENEAGREMKAVLAAADSGAQSYTFVNDAGESQTKKTPTKEGEFRSIVSRGAVEGMNTSDFNMMLGDKTSNLRALSTNEERQQAAFRQQPAEIARQISKQTSNRLSSNKALKDQVADPKQRAEIAAALGEVATKAADDLTMEQLQDPKQRNKAIAEALQTEASNRGVTLSEAESLNMAATSFGQRESVLRTRLDMDATSYAQTHGKAVRESREDKQAAVAARSGVNEAMSGLGPKGSVLQRLSTAVQKQGDRGEDANVETLLGDMFAGDMDVAAKQLNKPLESVRARQSKIESLTTKLEGASPEEKKNIQKEIKEETALLKKDVATSREMSESLGLTDKEGKFNQADVAKGKTAARELDHFNRMEQVRVAGSTAVVTDLERKGADTTKLTDNDFRVMAEKDRTKQLEAADKLSAGDLQKLSPEAKAVYTEAIKSGANEATARARVKEKLQSEVASVDVRAKEIQANLGADATVGMVANKELKDSIIQRRRSDAELKPTAEAVDARTELMRKDMSKQNEKIDQGLQVEAETARNKELQDINKIGAGSLSNMPPEAKEVYDKAIAEGATDQMARAKVKGTLQRGVASVEERTNRMREERGIEGQQKKLTKDEINALTPEARKEYKEGEKQLTRKAEDQLIAENQLRSLGVLGAEETLSGKGADIAKFEGLKGKDKDQLRKDLSTAKTEDRAAIVSKYIDSKQLDQFYGKNEAEVTKKREAANAYADSSEGKRAAQDAESRIGSLAETRREFLSDDKAISRGGARGIIAAKQSKESEEELQTMANKYFGGDVGKMVSSGGVALDKKGQEQVKADFGKLSEKEKLEAAARLKVSGKDIGVGTFDGKSKLTEKDYAAYLSLKSKDLVGTMKESIDGMAEGAGQTYGDLLKPTEATKTLAKELVSKDASTEQEKGLQALSSAATLKNIDLKKATTGLDMKKITNQIAAGVKVNTDNMTDEQKELIKSAEGMKGLSGLTKEQIKSLEAISKEETKDVKKDAEALGMTEEEYRKASKDGVIDPNLKLFKDQGVTGAEKLEIAKKGEVTLAATKDKLEKAKEVLAKDPESKEAKAEVDRLQESVAEQTAIKSARMKEAGLDSKKAEDVKKYEQRLATEGKATTPNMFKDDPEKKGVTAAEKLETAKKEEASLTDTKTELEKAKEVLAKDPESKKAKEDVDRLENVLSFKTKDKAERMKEAGLDINKPEDIKKYEQGLKDEGKAPAQKMFQDDVGNLGMTATEKFETAKKEEVSLTDTKDQLAKAKEVLAKDPESKEAKAEVDRLQGLVTKKTEDKSARMKEAGLDSSKAEDVKKYEEGLKDEGKAADPSLRLFKDDPVKQGKTATEKLETAKKEEVELKGTKDQLAKAKEVLAKDPESEKAKEDVAKLENVLAIRNKDKSERMKEVGLDSSKAEDVKKYEEGLQDEGKEADPSLRLFKDDPETKGKGTAKEQLQKAQKEEASLSSTKKQLEKAQARLEKSPKSEGAQREVDKLQGMVAKKTEDKAERMKEAGLDISKPEDVKKYEQRLNNQGKLEQLERNKEVVAAERQKLKDSGMSEADIDKHMSAIADNEKVTQAAAKEAKDKDLGTDAMNTLADAFGKTSKEDRQKFKENVGKGGESGARNKDMVANVLKDVGKISTLGDKNTSAIDKLDMLTDEYAAAKTPDAKKALAKKHGMSEDALESTMKKTEFMGMKDKTEKYTEKDLNESLGRVGNRDVQADVKKEADKTMKVTGTLQIKGTVNGEGTLNDTTSTGGAR